MKQGDQQIQEIRAQLAAGEGETFLRATTYGASILGWSVPCAEGMRDLLLGPDTVEGLRNQDRYFGATVGRVANRISGAEFAWPISERDGSDESLDSQRVCRLATNNGANCLHGGHPGYQERIWSLVSQSDSELVYSLLDPDGCAGFPGGLQVQVRYQLLGGEEPTLRIMYEATALDDTVCALTWHGYWNLRGHGFGSLEGHRLQVCAERFTELTEDSCPTGRCLPVEGTGLDFRQLLDVQTGLERDCPHLRQGRGLDHNYILHDEPVGALRLAAVLETDALRLSCYTTQPGIQVYTANYLDGDIGKSLQEGPAVVYGARSGICLETQAWPDAVHHRQFPSIVLRAGEQYRQETQYRLRFLQHQG